MISKRLRCPFNAFNLQFPLPDLLAPFARVRLSCDGYREPTSYGCRRESSPSVRSAPRAVYFRRIADAGSEETAMISLDTPPFAFSLERSSLFDGAGRIQFAFHVRPAVAFRLERSEAGANLIAGHEMRKSLSFSH